MNRRSLARVCVALIFAVTAGVAQASAAGPAAPAIGTIKLWVDATQAPQKIIHAKETIPVHAGALTLYYPEWIPGEHAPDGPVANLCLLYTSAQEVVDVSESTIEASGEDYNVYVPILNALGDMNKQEAQLNMTQRFCVALENHLKHVPEDARARILLGANYARLGREQDALRELNLAVTLRANEASILYNAACVYCGLKRKAEALDTLRKACLLYTSRCV